MSVEELIRRLRQCEKTAEVRIDDDEPLGEVEPMEADEGPVVMLWSKSLAEPE